LYLGHFVKPDISLKPTYEIQSCLQQGLVSMCTFWIVFLLVPLSNNSQVNWLIIIKSSRGVTRKINMGVTASLPAMRETR